MILYKGFFAFTFGKISTARFEKYPIHGIAYSENSCYLAGNFNT